MEQTNKVVVTLNSGVDKQQFMDEMMSAGPKSAHLPQRAVELFNAKEISQRNVDFVMTQAEMYELEKDPRIMGVRWGTKAENGIEFHPTSTLPDQKYFRAAGFYSNPNQAETNWGLARCANVNNANTDSNTLSGTFNFNYALGGEDVDIVIQDSGIQVDWNNGICTPHPEFQGRFVSKDLRTAGAVPWYPGQTVNNYTELDSGGRTTQNGQTVDGVGHGTHVAGIAAGKTYGWAKNANVYALHINLGTDTTGFSPELSFVYLYNFHLNKPINPKTGRRNPTIVNMSWGATGTVPTSLFNIYSFRSNSEVTFPTDAYSKILKIYQIGGILTSETTVGYEIPEDFISPTIIGGVTVTSIEAEIQQCISIGIIFVGAAGNAAYKVDILGGRDYNNYVRGVSPTRFYYMRGSSPANSRGPGNNYNTGVICVGNIDSETQGQSDQKALDSNYGPRIDVYAPGTDITSACSTVTNLSPVANYPSNTNYRIAKISGTSMASPQVCGVLACVLGMRPWMTQADARQWIIENSAQNQIYSSTTDFPQITSQAAFESTLRNLQGGPNRYLYFPYTGLRDANNSPTGNVFDMSGGANAQTGLQNQGGIAGSFGT